jgi:hypothetical protein
LDLKPGRYYLQHTHTHCLVGHEKDAPRCAAVHGPDKIRRTSIGTGSKHYPVLPGLFKGILNKTTFFRTLPGIKVRHKNLYKAPTDTELNVNAQFLYSLGSQTKMPKIEDLQHTDCLVGHEKDAPRCAMHGPDKIPRCATVRTRAVKHSHAQWRPPHVELRDPLAQDCRRTDYNRGSEAAPFSASPRGSGVGERGEKGDDLYGLAQAHFIA